MSEKEGLLADNEYVIISEVADNENITQRELSRKLDVSVSTVNILMNKLIREGLVKMTQVSQKQVLYMLTPVGMMEKAQKTVKYLKAHYRAIFETKEDIKTIINSYDQEGYAVYVLISDDEMGEILNSSVHEYKLKHSKSDIKIIISIQEIDMDNNKPSILLHMTMSEDINNEILKEYGDIENIEVIDITEQL